MSTSVSLAIMCLCSSPILPEIRPFPQSMAIEHHATVHDYVSRSLGFPRLVCRCLYPALTVHPRRSVTARY
ncbi:hypothetical protein C8Q78DRAFT_1054474 [Trametes maxima]|nr:hypothetical protein C8Q78DRAFT_1054474 [Trametes maxima]